jgi:pantoate--beta-alanine ligase
MFAAPTIARTREALQTPLASWRAQGLSIGLVPTMGALHEGHLSLIRRARTQSDRVAVSIFVNPTQFGPTEDFTAYPRREADDLAKLQSQGVELVWAPAPDIMYPNGFATGVAVRGLTDHLCGPFRPGHFQAVATVVTKLLLQIRPTRAFFGEKDFQQLQVIRRLARDLDIDVGIEGVPTVREPSGLALSSRNLYLDERELSVAPELNRILTETAEKIRGGAAIEAALAAAHAGLVAAGFSRIDYVELSDAESLAPARRLDRPTRLLAAVWLGKTRLIDNIAVN